MVKSHVNELHPDRPLGCIDANRDIHGFTGVQPFSDESAIPQVADSLTIMLRSFNDPIVQAIQITDGTFNMGLDPGI